MTPFRALPCTLAAALLLAGCQKVTHLEIEPRQPVIKSKGDGVQLIGKVMSGRVVREADRWFLCVAVDVGAFHLERAGDGTVGVDLGLTTLATWSSGEKIENPKPLRKAQKRLGRALVTC